MNNEEANITAKRTFRESWNQANRAQLHAWQLDRLNKLLSDVLANNDFYRQRYQRQRIELASLDELGQLPLMSKTDWISDEVSGVAKHHSYASDHYRRYHRTSGTRGRPMVILDTQSDWQWWIDTWQYVLDACQITRNDRVLMAFSFGPFIGFWSAHDACLHRQCMVIPSGGMSSEARIDLILASEPTVLFCTPSYAIHLGQLAESIGKGLKNSSIRRGYRNWTVGIWQHRRQGSACDRVGIHRRISTRRIGQQFPKRLVTSRVGAHKFRSDRSPRDPLSHR